MTFSTALPTVLAAAALALVAGCGSSPDARSAEPRETVDTDPVVARVGDFPEFPGGLLPTEVAASLQAMTDFRGEFYGLGTIDFSAPDEYAVPGAVGHGGMEESHAVRLAAFPDTGVIVAVQANADSLESIHSLVGALREAAVRP